MPENVLRAPAVMPERTGLRPLIAVWDALRARLRNAEVRKGAEERDVVAVDAVAEVVGRADQLSGHDLHFDIHDVVGETPAVRESLEIAVEHAKPLRTRIDGRVDVEAQHLGWSDTRRLIEIGHAGEKHR